MMLTTAILRLDERPVDSHDPLALETFQRFRERQETRASPGVETDFAKICPALRGSDGHDAIVFQERLEMPVRFWFLPEGIHFGPSVFLDDDTEANGFYCKQLHCGCRALCQTPPLLKRRFPETPYKKSPPENYGKEDQTTVAAFLLWR